jgi:DNA-binding GntR family transcriptional regulator
MSRAAGKAYETIRGNILAGTFPPGTHLKENLLASIGKVSRTPVREALRRLSAEGLVNFLPNRGAYVRTWVQRDIKEIFHLRMLLEGYGAEIAARRINTRQLDTLRRLQDRMDAAAKGSEPGHLNDIAAANDRFHKLIIQASGNGRLAALLSSIIEMPLVLGTFTRYTAQDLARSMSHHREMIAAFQAHDGIWARSVMQCHTLAAWHVMARPAVLRDISDDGRRGAAAAVLPAR